MNATETGEPIEAVLDLPIRYIDRSRTYYLALDNDNPYRWAHNEDVPFAPMRKPLNASRVALVTTAAPFNPSSGTSFPKYPCARSKPRVMGTRRSGPTRRVPPTS